MRSEAKRTANAQQDLDNRTRKVTVEQIKQVWGMLRENPPMGAGGVVKLRADIAAKFRAWGVCVHRMHAEAILIRGMELGWLKTTMGNKSGRKGGNNAINYVAVERVAEKDMFDVLTEIPLGASPSPHAFYKVEEPTAVPDTPVAPKSVLLEEVAAPVIEKLTAEGCVALCASQNLNGLDYLSKPDVLEVITLIAAERDAALIADHTEELDAERAKLEDTERIVDDLNTTQKELTQIVAKQKVALDFGVKDMEGRIKTIAYLQGQLAELTRDLKISRTILSGAETKLREVIADNERIKSCNTRLSEDLVKEKARFSRVDTPLMIKMREVRIAGRVMTLVGELERGISGQIAQLVYAATEGKSVAVGH